MCGAGSSPGGGSWQMRACHVGVGPRQSRHQSSMDPFLPPSALLPREHPVPRKGKKKTRTIPCFATDTAPAPWRKDSGPHWETAAMAPEGKLPPPFSAGFAPAAAELTDWCHATIPKPGPQCCWLDGSQLYWLGLVHPPRDQSCTSATRLGLIPFTAGLEASAGGATSRCPGAKPGPFHHHASRSPARSNLPSLWRSPSLGTACLLFLSFSFSSLFSSTVHLSLRASAECITLELPATDCSVTAPLLDSDSRSIFCPPGLLTDPPPHLHRDSRTKSWWVERRTSIQDSDEGQEESGARIFPS